MMSTVESDGNPRGSVGAALTRRESKPRKIHPSVAVVSKEEQDADEGQGSHPMPEPPTLTGMHFRLTLADREIAGTFREVSGLDSESEVIEERSVDDYGQPVVRKVPGATKWSDITLKRGVDSNRDLWEWREAARKEGAEGAGSDGTIELVDYEGRPVATYRFRQGWPVKYTGPTLAAGSNEVAVETITIAHEGLEWV